MRDPRSCPTGKWSCTLMRCDATAGGELRRVVHARRIFSHSLVYVSRRRVDRVFPRATELLFNW